MDVGMYGGKFMPFHKGHLYCVETALEQCDLLHVICCYNGDQELNIMEQYKAPEYLKKENREKTLERALKKYVKQNRVIIHMIDVGECKAADGTEDWDMETPLIRQACVPMFNKIFGSEPSYTEYFNRAYPEAEVVLIDVNREVMPISATKIRETKEEERKKWMV